MISKNKKYIIYFFVFRYILLENMTSKDVSSIKNRCTEENKAKCESEGKLCNPNPKSKNICFNNTEINRKK